MSAKHRASKMLVRLLWEVRKAGGAGIETPRLARSFRVGNRRMALALDALAEQRLIRCTGSGNWLTMRWVANAPLPPGEHHAALERAVVAHLKTIFPSYATHR